MKEVVYEARLNDDEDLINIWLEAAGKQYWCNLDVIRRSLRRRGVVMIGFELILVYVHNWFQNKISV